MRTPEFIQRCLNAGMDLQTALTAAKAFEAECEIALEEMLDVRRAKDRARQAKHRSKKAGDGDESHVTSRDQTSNDVTGVAERDLAPEPARVRDISPRLVNNNNPTTPERDCVWPETDPPCRADLDRLEVALRQAAGPALNAAAPRLFDLSPLLRLARQGSGPPCDLQADVLPTIRARSARAPPGSVKSWDFYRDAITEARDRRLSGAPAQSQIHELPHRHVQPVASGRAARRGVWAEVLAEERGEATGGRTVPR